MWYIAAHPKEEKTILLGGKEFFVDDLRGEYRQDNIMGYTHKENFTSSNGWWQTNNVDARSRKDTSKEKSKGNKRVLVFGESFTDCIGLKQEEVWTFILGEDLKNVDVLNFGVGGYSMAQCYLRLQTLEDKIDYDAVMFVFLLSIDLWRDINVLRALASDWKSYVPQPRYIVEDNKLKLISGPHVNYEDYHSKDKKISNEAMINFLKRYDRFYCSLNYEPVPFLDNSIICKLIFKKICQLKKELTHNNVMAEGSEAMRVTKKIFESVHEETNNEGKKFVLILLPILQDIDAYQKDHAFRLKWQAMKEFLCSQIACIDLMKPFLEIPRHEIDISLDKMHYGPKVNRYMAGMLSMKFGEMRLFDDFPSRLMKSKETQ